MVKKILGLMLLTGALLSCGICSQKKVIDIDGKPKYLWFDAEANFERFSSQDSIVYYLDKAKTAGFNQIVVDARPLVGDVLYHSDFMPALTDVKGVHIERDWDYLQFFIDQAHKRDMRVTVSTAIFSGGQYPFRSGPAFRDDTFKGRTCIEYTPQGMVDIIDDSTKVAVFLNPLLPENQDYALRFIKEILSKYQFEGYALDYCRFPGPDNDFSEATRVAFEKYIGQKVENFPQDIYTYNDTAERTPGKYYKQWWTFRASIIRDFVVRVKEQIKATQPDVKLEYWAASWINALYVNGQNWASKNYDYSQQEGCSTWASPEYKETGYADVLDVFLLGTYLDKIYGENDPESIEFGIARANKVVGEDCAVYGTIYAKNHEKNIEDAVYVCLSQSAGLMVFDIIQVIEFNLWDDIKKGIDRAENRTKR